MYKHSAAKGHKEQKLQSQKFRKWMDKKTVEFFFRVNYIFVLKQQAGQLLDMALSKNPFVLKAKDRVELQIGRAV